MTKKSMAMIYAYNLGYRVDEDGVIRNPEGKPLKVYISGGRYEYPSFGIKYGGMSRKVAIHRLAAYQKYGDEMFNDGIVCRHLDGDKNNSKPDNIEIGTHSQNRYDMPEEERVRNAAIASRGIMRDDWKDIDYDRKNGLSYRMLHSKYGVSKGTLSNRYRGGSVSLAFNI